MTGPLTLGAPGVYELPGTRVRALTGVRMDVCAFVGVSPRGPSRERPEASPWLEPGGPDEGRVRSAVPVAVESWEEYVRLFGGFEGPGRLPYAVHTFFRQGGRRAWVVRVVHRYDDVRDLEGAAAGAFPGIHAGDRRGLRVRAALPGEAGRGTRARVSWDVLPLTLHGGDARTLDLDGSAPVAPGSLLRLELPGGERALAFVASVRATEEGGTPLLKATLPGPLAGVPVAAERVEATLDVESPGGATEAHGELGLSPDHPRWLGRVLADESALLAPDPRWSDRPLLPLDAELPPPPLSRPLAGGGSGLPAEGRIPGLEPVGEGLWLRARNEGRWGDRLRAELSFSLSPTRGRLRSPTALETEAGSAPPTGTLLRARLDDGADLLVRVVDSVEEWEPGQGDRVRVLTLDRALTSPVRSLEIVEADLRVVEEPQARAGGPLRSERHRRLGLSPEHPRWLHRVLARESELVRPDPEWAERPLRIPLELATGGGSVAAAFAGGEDRYGDIVHEDFFDDDWDPLDQRPGAGVHAVAGLDEPALLVVPDLYSPGPLAPFEPVVQPASLAGPEFAECVPLPEPPEQGRPDPELPGLRLDPRDPTERARIAALQGRLETLAETVRSFVVLLDVPPELDPDDVLRWRAGFRSAFTAAYHPWVRVSVAEDRRDAPVRVNPAAAAAGIIARQEILFGLPHGPANALAAGVVDVAGQVSRAAHDALHQAGVNVFLRERDGVRLMGARTLAARPSYRQLSVRRLVTMITRTLDRRMQWTVFEPHDFRLREQLRHLLTVFMRELFTAGAFTGATEKEAFFVRCDEELNPQRVVDAGRVVAEIGIAPSEPVEFLVLRIVRDADGTVRAEG